MPVAATDGQLVQFVYRPRYLRAKKFSGLITPPTCYRQMPYASGVRESVVILDGGAIEIYGRTGIVTERVFGDNYWYDKGDLVEKLERTLKLDKLIIIPVEPGDETGHVDGVVRFVNEKQVVMNDYAALEGRAKVYGKKVESKLRGHGIDHIHYLPYAPTDKKGPDGMPEATGCYINFLRTGSLVLLPQFGIPGDRNATEVCEHIFSGCVVETVDCSQLAKSGGILNCISWRTGAGL
jgi:agmatine deiminase